MGADNIVEAAIVTPRGELITANECQNKDLFWAIRGGRRWYLWGHFKSYRQGLSHAINVDSYCVHECS